MSNPEQTAKEFVLAKHPNAFIHDDGEKVCVKLQTQEDSPCPHCGQKWTRNIIPALLYTFIGAGNENDAWENAKKQILILQKL